MLLGLEGNHYNSQGYERRSAAVTWQIENLSHFIKVRPARYLQVGVWASLNSMEFAFVQGGGETHSRPRTFPKAHVPSDALQGHGHGPCGEFLSTRGFAFRSCIPILTALSLQAVHRTCCVRRHPSFLVCLVERLFLQFLQYI